MTLTAIDCQSFAGGFSYGVVKAGFEVIAKREYPGAFGAAAMEGNRHLLGSSWKLEDTDPGSWSPRTADLVFGNPPCSGFSARSVSIRGRQEDGSIGLVKFRGVESVANQCMWGLVEYAAKCDPKIVIFESVQGAFRKGSDLMLQLRTRLEDLTGQAWSLYHVLHNVSDLGGAQLRPRYFWVASRIPFGVTLPKIDYRTTVRDRIGDLENVPLGSMDGHVIDESPQELRIRELATKLDWLPGETSGHVYARAIEQGIQLELWDEPLVSDKGTTQFAPKRLDYDKPSRVLAGDAYQKMVHPVLPRTLTHREIARLSGFPDDWSCAPYMQKKGNSFWWGKGICVEAGEWIAKAAYDAIMGEPHDYEGEHVGPGEFLIDAQLKDTDITNETPLFDLVGAN